MDKIKEALARGYCTKRNEHKVLDPDLIEDMAKEIKSLEPKVISEVSIYDLADILRDIVPHYRFFTKDEQLTEASMLKEKLKSFMVIKEPNVTKK